MFKYLFWWRVVSPYRTQVCLGSVPCLGLLSIFSSVAVMKTLMRPSCSDRSGWSIRSNVTVYGSAPKFAGRRVSGSSITGRTRRLPGRFGVERDHIKIDVSARLGSARLGSARRSPLVPTESKQDYLTVPSWNLLLCSHLCLTAAPSSSSSSSSSSSFPPPPPPPPPPLFTLLLLQLALLHCKKHDIKATGLRMRWENYSDLLFSPTKCSM